MDFCSSGRPAASCGGRPEAFRSFFVAPTSRRQRLFSWLCGWFCSWCCGGLRVPHPRLSRVGSVLSARGGTRAPARARHSLLLSSRGRRGDRGICFCLFRSAAFQAAEAFQLVVRVVLQLVLRWFAGAPPSFSEGGISS